VTLELIEFGPLSDSQRDELEAGEEDPFDAAGNTLSWRPKERHVALRQADGRLVASTGFVLAELQSGDDPPRPFVGIGGVFVTRDCRGQGLGDRIIDEALAHAADLGPEIALLFCHEDRSRLYQRHGFTALTGEVRVRQPDGLSTIPQVAMWRPLHEGATLGDGPLTVNSLPF
jgi:predicted GNAT family N-acyltransferase